MNCLAMAAFTRSYGLLRRSIIRILPGSCLRKKNVLGVLPFFMKLTWLIYEVALLWYFYYTVRGLLLLYVFTGLVRHIVC